MVAVSGPLSFPSGVNPAHSSSKSHKLYATLPTLDPTDRLAISDWLVNFTAAAGTDFELLWRAGDEWEPTVALWRIATQHLDATRYPRDDIIESYAQWLDVYSTMSQTAFGWIINAVKWTADPALRFAVTGTPGVHDGFDAKKDGRGLFLWLRERGSVSSADVQDQLIVEWSHVHAESHATSTGRTRSLTVFDDVSSSDAVIAQLHRLRVNYESVPSQASQPPINFIKAVTTLLGEDVSPLRSWAEQP